MICLIKTCSIIAIMVVSTVVEIVEQSKFAIFNN